MSIVTSDLTISLDGYSAGPNQSRDQPFGDGVGGGEMLHAWMFDHRDANAAEVAGILDAGAFILGRNMFGPDRGEPDLSWTGWWDGDTPYPGPAFVLTHYPREPLELPGGTFHFVTGGPEEALRLAREAAGDRNVSIAGGASTISQYLALGAIDELRLHVTPQVLACGGVRLFDGVPPATLRAVSARHTPEVTHLTYRLG